MYFCNNKYLIVTKNIQKIDNIILDNEIEFLTGTLTWIIIKFININSVFIYDTKTMNFQEIIPLFFNETNITDNIYLADSRDINNGCELFIICNKYIYIQTILYNGVSFHTEHVLQENPLCNKKYLISICKYSGNIGFLINEKVIIYSTSLKKIIYEKILIPYILENIISTQLHKNSFYLQTVTTIIEYNLDHLNLVPKLICRNERIKGFYIDTSYLYVFIERYFPRNKSYILTGMIIYDSTTMDKKYQCFIKYLPTSKLSIIFPSHSIKE